MADAEWRSFDHHRVTTRAVLPRNGSQVRRCRGALDRALSAEDGPTSACGFTERLPVPDWIDHGKLSSRPIPVKRVSCYEMVGI
jgi:hypothetical protein